jgi:DNA helicase-2/ATP-dependent DNA helicase PcrA
MTPCDGIKKIVYEAGYVDHIERQVIAGNSRQVLFQKVNTLLAISMEYTNIPDFLARLGELSEYKKPEYSTSPNITLSTMHSSKGLEFDKVIIIDAFDGLLPSEFAMKKLEEGNRDDYEEEVRLFYVAITRAKEHLIFITTNKRFGLTVYMSMFLTQLSGNKQSTQQTPNSVTFAARPLSLSDLTPGKMVEHKYSGEGSVVSVNGNLVSIRFSNGTTKTYDAIACITRNIIWAI